MHQALVIGRRHRGVGKDQMQLPCQRPGRGTGGRCQLQRVQRQRHIAAGGRCLDAAVQGLVAFHAAAAQAQDVGAVLVEFAEDVAGDDQGHALCLQRPHQLGQAGAGLGVQAAGRLVQQQHARLVDDGLADGHALALAARQLGGQALQQIGQAQLPGHVRHALGRLGRGHAHGQGRVLQAAPHAQAVIEAEEIRQIAQVPVHFAGLLLHRNAMHLDLARQRLVQPGDAAHQRGFAGAVGPHQGRDGACGDMDADAIERAVAGVLEHQLRNLDQGEPSLIALMAGRNGGTARQYSPALPRRALGRAA